MGKEFKLPELGENVTSGTIVSVLVKNGDTVSKDQPILEIETDKAVVEIPSPYAGTVSDVRVKEGQKVSVGQVVFVVEEGDSAGGKKAEEPAPAAEQKQEAAAEQPVKQQEVPQTKTQPEMKASETAPATSTQEDRPRLQLLERDQASGSRMGAMAAPSVRRAAREMGLDITKVPTSDPAGRVSMEDLRNFTQANRRKAAAPAVHAESAPEAPATGTSVEEDKYGAVIAEPMNAIRRKTAEFMTECWTTIPHVTQHDKADITSLETLRKKHGKGLEAAGGKLTVTSFIIKLLASALKKYPRFNSSLDLQNERVLLKQYYHVGVAVDTPNGLLVPVIRDVDQKSVADISLELPELARKARDRKLSLEEMQGATFTVSNLGGFGGTGFTPIISAPQVAILGVSRAVIEPVWQDGQFGPRLMMPLSLSYDHRVIDGADAARFLRWYCEALEQPWLLYLD